LADEILLLGETIIVRMIYPSKHNTSKHDLYIPR